MKTFTLKNVDLKSDKVLSKDDLRKILGGGSGSGSGSGSKSGGGSGSEPGSDSDGSGSGSGSGSAGSGSSGGGSGSTTDFQIHVQNYSQGAVTIGIDGSNYLCPQGYTILPLSYDHTVNLYFSLPCIGAVGALSYTFNGSTMICGSGLQWFLQSTLTINIQ